MGQKVNPIGYRTGVFLGWKSRWYASKKEFGELLVEDQKIRKFVKTRKTTAGRAMYPMISKVEIERTRDEVKVILYSGRARDLSRASGKVLDELQEDLQNLIGRRVAIEVQEVSKPNLVAQLIAEDIGEQLVKRASFRRAMKRSIEQAMEAGAKGIKIQLSGRLGGAEMSRCEKAIEGSIPLSTLRANIDYGFHEAKIAQGHIGIQVWINLGAYSEGKIDGVDAETNKTQKGPKRTYKR
ncbi:MAG: 30S ribosomal protein S3 [Planctomycetia bacterium]|nr:30S ribosomal protein S3 [Planctomycetia bacterium]MDO5112751.1 30S ribosomal protein S3 [Planctomycetia bacterium]